MIKKAALLVLLIPLLIFAWNISPVQAVDGLVVTGNSAEVDFPAGIIFRLSAQSDAEINDIRLHYMVVRMSHAQVISEVHVDFEPDTAIETEWFWDMRKTGGLPPGSGMEYWWTVTDAQGSRVQTEVVEVRVEDRRHDWQSLTTGKVTLYWYEGDDSFVRELMTTAHQVLLRLAADTGVVLENAVKIYIYANQQALLESMIFPQEWTGGVAFTRYGIIAVSISPGRAEWGNRVIAHELTHLVIHQMNFNPYGGLPTWLDEGLAMYAEGEAEPSFADLLVDKAREDELISVRSLASPFSAYAEESILAYAQSYSLVKYLIDNYGQEKMYELLCEFKEGSGYDVALLKVYGFDMDGLNGLWRDYITASIEESQPALEEKPHVWVLFALIVGACLLVLVIIVLWYYGRLGLYRG